MEFLVKMITAACAKEISTRADYDVIMDAIALNPTHVEVFLGMTNKYHADAMLYPLPDYQKIRTPYLVVTGVKDTPVTYLRVEDMDHYVRKRPDILSQSFEWLRQMMLRWVVLTCSDTIENR